MAAKRDNEILDNMSYDRAEEIVIETLKLAIKDLKRNIKARDKAKSYFARKMYGDRVIECKRYIANGLHREIVDSDPRLLIEMIESEAKKSGRRKGSL